MDGVLFIDEAYGLIPNDHASESDFGGAVMRLLLEYTDPAKKMPICFICAGYTDKMEVFLEKTQGCPEEPIPENERYTLRAEDAPFCFL